MTSDQSPTAFSILIAAWNCWSDLERCLDSILRDPEVHPSFETIVVDNGSEDGTPAKLARSFPTVRLVRNEENLGHTRAVNQGIELARGEFLLVLDADTVVKPGAFVRLLTFLKERPEVAVVAPRMFNGDGSIQETARSFPRPINGLLGRQSLLTRWFPNNRFVRSYMRSEQRGRSSPFRVDWVSAACMMFPAALVRRIGSWDEGYHSYWVDADWCLRAANAGGAVYCIPEAQVVHFEQNRRGKRKSASRIILFHRSVNRFYRKHYTRGWLDPRAAVASLVLGVRAVLLIAGNLFLPADGTAETKDTMAILEERPTKE